MFKINAVNNLVAFLDYKQGEDLCIYRIRSLIRTRRGPTNLFEITNDQIKQHSN